MPDDEPGDWETLRADAIAAVREAVKLSGPKSEAAVDAVLSVVDEEATRRYCAEMIDQTHVTAMGVDAGGGLDMKVARDVALGWAGAARTLLGDAPNYCESVMEFGLPEKGERYAFTIQKIGKLTPHQARMQAENARDEALAEVERLRDLLGEVPGGQ